MEAIENAAFVSVGRASGFAGLAVFCIMFGLSFEPALSARTGGALCLGLTLILSLYGICARARPYKRTEVWLILPKDERPPAGVAQQLIGEALRDTYLWFARQTAMISVVLLVSSGVLQLIGL
jgi:hypothetical protein